MSATDHSSFEQFESAWNEFFAAYRRSRGRAVQKNPPVLTPSQFHLLSPLVRQRELPVGELAIAAGVAPPTATRMLDTLLEKGLVERVRSESDRRVVVVTLSSKGRRLVTARLKVGNARRLAIYETLSEDDRDSVAKLLKRLTEVVDEL